MLFLFLIISQLMAMDVDVPEVKIPEISPRKTIHKRSHDDSFEVDYKYILECCKSYQSELKEKEIQPKYSNFFTYQISKLIKKHPNFLEIIYGENFSNSIDHSILFSQSAKKRKLKEGEIPNVAFKNSLDDIKPFLATPTKIGTNTYHFPIEGILPEGTPRRIESLIRLFAEFKMPIYVAKGEVTSYNLHHLCQRDQNEDILLLSKEVHQKDSGAIHTSGKVSEINRAAFKEQKIRAVQLYFLRKIEQAVKKLAPSLDTDEAMVADAPQAGSSSVVSKLSF